MRKTVLILFVFLFTSRMGMAQTDEQLREEIRKEILEEQRQKEAKELLEYRKEKIRREEEARIKAEKDSLNKVLLGKNNDKEKEQFVAAATKEDQKDRMTTKRIDGWSISVTAGPNIPLGSYAKSNSSGDYALLGAYVSMDNYWHFGRVMGLVVGFSYDNNKFNAEVFVNQAMTQAGLNPNNLSIINSTRPYSNVSFRIGPNIRYLGNNASLHFNPFIGMSIHEMYDLRSDISDGSNFAFVSIKGKGNTYFITGADLSCNIHFGGRVDAIIGLRFTYGNVKVNFTAEGTNSPITNNSAKYDVLNLAPNFGLRFHL